MSLSSDRAGAQPALQPRAAEVGPGLAGSADRGTASCCPGCRRGSLLWPGLPLDNVDLAIERGSFFTVIGPSGAGKSTLLRVMAGLVVPDSGSVSVFGEAPAEASRAKHIGWVPQSPALLPWRTVLENVRLPLEVNRACSLRGTRPRGNPRSPGPTPGPGHAAGAAFGGHAPASCGGPCFCLRTQRCSLWTSHLELSTR